MSAKIDMNLQELINTVAEKVSSLQAKQIDDLFNPNPRPCYESIRNFYDLIQNLCLPSYRRREIYSTETVFPTFQGLIYKIYKLGQELIAADLSYELGRESPFLNFEQLAAPKIQRLIQEIPKIIFSIQQDIEHAFRNDPSVKSERIIKLAFPGINALIAYRFAHVLDKEGVPNLPRMLTEIAHSKTGIDIHPHAEIEPGIFIDHGTGTVIGETCIIGSGCIIYQNVTLGTLKFEKDSKTKEIIRNEKRHPTLGKDVKVYAGASILGNIIIGDRCVIGSHVRIKESLKPGTKVVVMDQAYQERINRDS